MATEGIPLTTLGEGALQTNRFQFNQIPLQAPSEPSRGYLQTNTENPFMSSLYRVSNPAMTSPQQAGGGGGGSSFLSGLLGGAKSFIAGGGIGGVIGLVGQGINAWLSYKDQKEAEEDARKRYESEMKENVRRWESEMEIRRQQMKMSKMEFYNNIKNQQEQMRNYYDERNNQRYNGLYTNMMNMLNTSGLRNKYLETWGRK